MSPGLSLGPKDIKLVPDKARACNFLKLDDTGARLSLLIPVTVQHRMAHLGLTPIPALCAAQGDVHLKTMPMSDL